MREATLLIQLFGLTQLYDDESGRGVKERKYPKPSRIRKQTSVLRKAKAMQQPKRRAFVHQLAMPARLGAIFTEPIMHHRSCHRRRLGV